MDYSFLVDTYTSERFKTLSVWSMFGDGDLDVRPIHVEVPFARIATPRSSWVADRDRIVVRVNPPLRLWRKRQEGSEP